MKIRVYYEDTDVGGVVYHANYLKFCERARSELFFEHNLTPEVEKDAHFLVRRMNCDFVSSARLGDLLTVCTKLTKMKNASCVISQEIFKEEELLFSAEVYLAFVREGRPAKIPEETKSLLSQF